MEWADGIGDECGSVVELERQWNERHPAELAEVVKEHGDVPWKQPQEPIDNPAGRVRKGPAFHAEGMCYRGREVTPNAHHMHMQPCHNL